MSICEIERWFFLVLFCARVCLNVNLFYFSHCSHRIMNIRRVCVCARVCAHKLAVRVKLYKFTTEIVWKIWSMCMLFGFDDDDEVSTAARLFGHTYAKSMNTHKWFHTFGASKEEQKVSQTKSHTRTRAHAKSTTIVCSGNGMCDSTWLQM